MVPDGFFVSQRDFPYLNYPRGNGKSIASLGQFSRHLLSPGCLFANLNDIRHQMMHDYDIENLAYTFAYPRSAGTPNAKVVVTEEDLRKDPDTCLEHVVKIIAKKYDELMTRRYFNMGSEAFNNFVSNVQKAGGTIKISGSMNVLEGDMLTVTIPVHSAKMLIPCHNLSPIPGVSGIQFYNDRVTVVRFADGSFTKCVADVDEEGKSCFDPYTGVAFCLFKRMLGKEDGHKKFNNLMRKAMGVMDAKKKALEEQEKMKVERLRKEINKNNKKVRRAAEDREAFIEDIAEAVRRANAREVDK